jgi:hypothetical protein
MSKVLTDKDIENGNKLIAEFMVPNWESLKDGNYLSVESFGLDLITATCLCAGDYSQFRYHVSFDSLFRVIEKIEDIDGGLSYFITLSGHLCIIKYIQNIYSDDDELVVEYSGLDSDSKIQNYWCAIVEFIKYYNKILYDQDVLRDNKLKELGL